MQVVRSYEDSGKSGLTLRKRGGVLRLLDDVESGNADYTVILVYDVSRWGGLLSARGQARRASTTLSV